VTYGARFVEARAKPDDQLWHETVILDVEYDRVQRPEYDLKPIERTATVPTKEKQEVWP